MLKDFYNYLEKINAYTTSIALMEFDLSTVTPKEGQANLAKSIGILVGEKQSLLTSAELKGYLDYMEKNFDQLDDFAKRTYTLVKKQYDDNTKIPKDVLVKYKELASIGESKWLEAREKNDYSIFAPTLSEIINYSKKIADYLTYEESRYTRLIQEYDEGFDIKTLDNFFNEIKEKVVPIIKKVKEKNIEFNNKFITKNVDIDKNKILADYLIDYLGFNKNKGFLSESAHPFTLTLCPGDVRITTRYEKLIPSIYSIMHEVGHGLYEQNTMKEICNNSILAGGVSMSLHESQSRFVENIIGRSPAFAEVLYNKLVETFDDLEGLTKEDLYKAINKVELNFIRVNADELTYPLHILIRYELEKELINGDINVMDLPKLWDDKYEKYLGIRPKNLKEGILQDIHWSAGLIGYFPSYAVGTAISSQLFYYMSKTINIEECIMNSNVEEILNWLKVNIHQYGKLLTPKELLIKATGEDFNPKYYVEYLENKYLSL